ncbi:AAA family ATPase [Rhizobium brockwellii]|uniref:AAA family ATPase n=1 Tax=Rhizobium brockwellii TaxID=3019932 RepID=UPI003F982E7C
MRYKRFQIKNFKGIKDTVIDLSNQGGAAVFPVVGLNESGKTTILEALYWFSPDAGSSKLSEETKQSAEDFVPRHLLASFTGPISVSGTLELEAADKTLISLRLAQDDIVLEEIPDTITLERSYIYENSNLVEYKSSITPKPRLKNKTSRKYREPNEEEQKKDMAILLGKNS